MSVIKIDCTPEDKIRETQEIDQKKKDKEKLLDKLIDIESSLPSFTDEHTRAIIKIQQTTVRMQIKDLELGVVDEKAYEDIESLDVEEKKFDYEGRDVLTQTTYEE